LSGAEVDRGVITVTGPAVRGVERAQHRCVRPRHPHTPSSSISPPVPRSNHRAARGTTAPTGGGGLMRPLLLVQLSARPATASARVRAGKVRPLLAAPFEKKMCVS
jgi:hypothetical protein